MKTTLTALTLSAALALPAAAFDLSAMTDAERDAFGTAVRSYLMENPEVIIEAVNALEAKQAQQQASLDDTLVQVHAEALFNDPNSWVGGNPEGDITVVEFVDYRCGYCRRAHDEVAQLLEGDGNIRLIVKEFPILGDNSLVSSRFALAARIVGGDDAYKAAGDALIAMNGEATEPALRRLAETLELDADAVIAAMGDETVTAAIASTRALADSMQINGTPTFVMGDRLVRGYVPLDGMRQIIAEERSDS